MCDSKRHGTLWSLCIISSLTLPITNISCYGSIQDTTGMAKTAFMVTNVTCDPKAPDVYTHSGFPSVLYDLRLQVTCSCEGPILNISWAVKVDATIDSAVGIWLEVLGQDEVTCIYHPPLKTVRGRKDYDLLWFSHTVPTEAGEVSASAHSVPEDPFTEDEIFKSAKTYASGCTTAVMRNHHECRPTVTSTTDLPLPTKAARILWTESPKSLLIVVAPMLTMCLLLATGFSLYMFHCRASQSPSKEACEAVVRVPVLMVYPAVDGVFQQAVVTLADYLQGSGGCDVAMDMWEQGPLAQLGPLRWLHSHSESANRVLIVLPGCPPARDECEKKLLPACQTGHDVPASAHQLFPMALKILPHSKLWVVHLGKVTSSSSVPVELRGCESFALLEDLQKLLGRLHSPQTPEGKGLNSRLRRSSKLGCQNGGLGKLKEVLKQLEQWERSKCSRDLHVISV